MLDVLGGSMPYNIDRMAYLTAALSSHEYAREHMQAAPRFGNRTELLAYAVSQVTIEGMVAEFGVAAGHTLNLLSQHMPDRKCYGFDSFKGLPEQWTEGTPAGHFAVEQLPQLPANVELVVGWFDRTLPEFVDSHTDNVALLHIDCDLYSSTQTVFAKLRKRIVPGTIIVFDEYFNYPNWQRHEHKAFMEWVAQDHVIFEYIGLVPQYEHVAARILKREE
jgi:hypothetical protein